MTMISGSRKNTRILLVENNAELRKGSMANVPESVTDPWFVENVWRSGLVVAMSGEKMPRQIGLYEVDPNQEVITAVNQEEFNSLSHLRRMMVLRSAIGFAESGMDVSMRVGPLGDGSENSNLPAIILFGGGLPQWAAVREDYKRTDIPPLAKDEYIVLVSPRGGETVIKPEKGMKIEIRR